MSAEVTASAVPRSSGIGSQKVRSLDDLAAIIGELRAAGLRVVHCHGAFDLLHLGHVRHLEAARALGDVLVVTVTADRQVNKGPGRPAFSEAQRAEMVAAVEHVNWVAINDDPDAVELIGRVRPDVYVKGREYADESADVTGKITPERMAVERHGGRIHLTDEITFSSTELINRHVDRFTPPVAAHLDAMRAEIGVAALLDLIERVRDYRVLVIGDAIIDEYQYVRPMAKAPKESVIAVRSEDREVFAGGVFAAANHVAAICRQVDVITCVGADDPHEELVRTSLRPNVRVTAIRRQGAPTTLKRRFVEAAPLRKMFEVYTIDDSPLPDHLQTEVDDTIASGLADYDLVIVTDFGHGLVAPSTIDRLSRGDPAFLAVNTQTNCANLGYNLITKHRRADYICIDEAEARLALGDRHASTGELARRVSDERIDCPYTIVTAGRNGCVVHDRGGEPRTLPALATNVVDTMGAGDAFFSVTAPLLRAGGSIAHVGFIGNVVGALEVEIVGHRRCIDKAALVKSIQGLLR